MKMLTLKAIDRLELIDGPIPTPQKDQLLIQTATATICTSDINDLRRNPFGISLPIVIGHEAGGTVAAVGAAVAKFRVGQRVTTHPVHPCGNCPPCREGLGHLCLNLAHLGFNLPGTMAEYYCVREDRVRVLTDDVSFAAAALMEPVCVCLQALDQARVSTGDSLLIIGDGPFGVLMARLAERRALKRVVLAGRIDFRLDFAPRAMRLNASNTADPIRVMLNANDGQGYHAAILAAGDSAIVATGLKCLRPRGRLVVFSALPTETPVDLLQVHLKELEIVGACSDREKIDEAVGLLDDPALRLSELVTHQFCLDDYQAAFDLAEFGKDRAMKVSFVF